MKLFLKLNLLFISVFLFYGCSDKKKSEPVVVSSKVKDDSTVVLNRNNELSDLDIAKDNNKDKEYSCEECVDLVRKIVKTSDYDKYFKSNYSEDYTVLIDEATPQKVTIQIVFKDKEQNDVPMGWLELDLGDEKLKNISNDPDEPELVKSDDVLIGIFKSKCLKCCTD